MKKRNLLIPALAGMMVFTACSSEDMPNPVEDNGGVQEIVLQVSSYGDELQTRAGRKLLSDAAAQQIDKVTVIICDADGKIAYAKTVDDWMNNTDVAYYGGNRGRQTKFVIPSEEKIPTGSYKIYAFGYSDPDPDSDTSNYDLTAIKGLKKGDTYTENVVLDYNAGKTTPEEIFAGAVDLSVGNDKDFDATVVLNRQVAGAYVYAYNIPYFDGIDGDYTLNLEAIDANDQLILGYFNSFDLKGNGTGNTGNINYVVNGGKKGNPSTTICSVKLGDWYTEFKDDDENNILDDAGWISTKANKTENGGNYKQGSVFAGNFVIPFKRVENQQTLRLVLRDGNNAEVFSWKVNLSSTELAANQRFTYWTGDKFETIQEYSNTKNVYSLVRNHLYSVGKKYTDGKPTDPTDPDPTPDEPQDLSKNQDLELQVNSNWEVIHRMELD